MSTNRVLSYKNVMVVQKAGKHILLGAAVETELFNRPDAGITPTSTEAFKRAVLGSTQPLPEGTKKLIWR